MTYPIRYESYGITIWEVWSNMNSYMTTQSIMTYKLLQASDMWNIQHLMDSIPVPKPNPVDTLDDVHKHNILCILDIDRTEME